MSDSGSSASGSGSASSALPDAGSASSASSSSSASSAAASAGAAPAASDSKDAKAPEASVAPEGDPLDKIAMAQLKLLLFGKSPEPQDVNRWHFQGFSFSKNPTIPWGLTQLYGGPCGILAPVQAWVLRDLLFGGEQKVTSGSDTPIKPSAEQCTAALLRSLALILERAAKGGKGLIVVTGTAEQLYQKRLKTTAEVIELLQKQLPALRSNIGVLLFVYSVLLSRGVDQVKSDMDDPGLPLVARFGHCTQELVNLMLCGQAVTNVFDGQKVLDDGAGAAAVAGGSFGDDFGGGGGGSYVMKGIPAQNEIGYLTQLENLRVSFVGEHYKTPNLPIWIVGSETHYTVLFALDKRVVQVSPEEKLMQTTRAAFNELDPAGNCYIERRQMPALLKKLGILEPVDVVLNIVDPDNMGICLWEKVAEAVKMRQAMAKSEWDCPTCTFKNAGTRKDCEMCGTAQPPQSKTPEKKSRDPELSEKGGLKNFALYHFNGLDGHGKAVAECCRMTVTLIDGGVQTVTHQQEVNKRGLREVIQTRFANAMVEYAGKEPKIS